MPVTPLTKRCIDCHEDFLARQPHRQERCPKCQKAHLRDMYKASYAANKDAYARAYAANPEKYRERARLYQEKNREIINRKRRKQYREEHKGETHGDTQAGSSYFRETLTANRAVVVVYDPLPVEDGGFVPGQSMFPYEDLPFMLQTGALTTGTLIEQRGKRYIGQGRELREAAHV